MEEFHLQRALKLLEVVQSTETMMDSIAKLEAELSESEIVKYLENFNCICSGKSTSWKYSCYLFYLLATVIDKVDLTTQENILGTEQLNSVVHAIQECSTHALETSVKKQSRTTYSMNSVSDKEYQQLTGCLRMFHKLFSIKAVNSNSLFDDSKLDYIIGLLTVISLSKSQDDLLEFRNLFRQITSTFTTELVFKFLVMIKGFSGFSKPFHLITHRYLMFMIRAPNGFLHLCKTLLVKPQDQQAPLWQKSSMISTIMLGVVRSKNNDNKQTIDDIFETLDVSIKKEERDIAGASVFVLSAFEKMEDLKELIYAKIFEHFNELVQPEVLLFSSIVMERSQLIDAINRLHALFSTFTIESLQTLILQKYIRVMFNIYSLLPESNEKQKLARVIIYYLSNRDRQELQKTVQELRLKDIPNSQKLHPRICFKNESLQIGAESDSIPDDTDQFLILLKDSNNNFLIYDTFLCLINILGTIQSSSDNFLSELDVAEEDLPEVLHRKFFKKLAILEPLQEMIQWNSLHSQLNEKPKEVLDAIKNILKMSVEKRDAIDEHLVLIFCSIFKELLSRLRDENQRKAMIKSILEIKDKCKDLKMRNQIDEIFNEEVRTIDPSKVVYDDAVNLMRSKEIYCKVYGSDTLIKLLKKRDSQAVLNRHTILALALQNLKETESYAYLNVIRLLVALTYVMDSEVVDALVADYQNKELDIDKRLKIGEVIVKVTEDLGEMSIKFKDQLIKCFLIGCRDNHDEFRTSSLANLGGICKILSYQIHSFFNEMFQQLEGIIKHDEYLPSKRAAAMVLSQILSGLPNLMEFQDFLLPIYRLLKEILEVENDEQTRLHAGIGLDHLNAKTKDFLEPKLEVAKEIKIRLDENPHKISEIKYK